MFSSHERIAEGHLGNQMRHNDDRVLAPIALERWESDGGASPRPQRWTYPKN